MKGGPPKYYLHEKGGISTTFTTTLNLFGANIDSSKSN